MKYIFDIPDNVDYGVLTCRTSNGYYEYNFDGADLKQLPPANTSEIPNSSDTISRAKAIDAIDEIESEIAEGFVFEYEKWRKYFCDLPPAQPEIIRCRNCKFASGDSRICMKFGHSPIGELDFCAWAERRTDEQTKD